MSAIPKDSRSRHHGQLWKQNGQAHGLSFSSPRTDSPSAFEAQPLCF